MIRDAASERQAQAANPGNSTWLSANAGSGKTRVLTDRVARLLMAHVPPQRILCLTYTKAAASEMQIRLFNRLGAWAMLGDADLRDALRQLGLDGPIEGTTLREARRLFARAIETPGGLKIQTIHSFCAGLLRRFPLEAGVSPQFTEMDDRAAKRLRAEIVEDMADGPAADVFAALAWFHTDADLDVLTAEVARQRDALPRVADADAVWRMFGLTPGTDSATVLRGVFNGTEPALIQTLLPVLQASGTNDQKAAAVLGALDFATPSLGLLAALEGPFLFGAKTTTAEPFSAKIGSFPTQAARGALGSALDDLNALMARVEEGRRQRLGLLAAEKTLALHRFAAAFLPLYERRKQSHGWLDFDDLILRAKALLTDPGVAQWVLFRLDGGLDHILVDEAQDTSPAQWQVIELLAQEFTAGEGARTGVERTIFVVGDKKQSIYSFQGADPDGFDTMKAAFGARLDDIGRALQSLTLEHSFRSSPAILGVVDQTFPPEARQGLDKNMHHRAFYNDLPGRVDLWPVIEDSGPVEPGDWADPVDALSTTHHMVQLAQRIASEIRAMIDRGETLAVRQKDGTLSRSPVTEGDILILVQRRSELFHEVIRACKAQGLEVAGADRLKIGGELAVRDLTALLSFLALPEDDLSLACALRSPLFGWDEKALYRLAANRGRAYLAEALRNADWADAETKSTLTALRNEADFLRPYDLLERILTRHDGRRRLVARLGEEAEDGIDALLAQALAFERMQVPSLTGFLAWIASDEVEIKRQLDSAGSRIRVMTVHGAKGLESPIVILPDTAQRDIRIRDNLYPLPCGGVAWKTAAADQPPALQAAHAALRQRQVEERARLLYVAMTRAEQWLIVAAAGNLSKEGDDWYSRMRAGIKKMPALPLDLGFGTGLRVETGDWTAGARAEQGATPPPPPVLPDWVRTPATRPVRPAQPVSPSDLGGAKVLPGEGEGLDAEAAKARGTWSHLLLEHLPGTPKAQRAALARALLTACDPPAPEAAIGPLLAEVETLLARPELVHVFGPDALAEVALGAQVLGRPLRGAIDRLVVGSDHVLAVDFKTNAVIPDQPEDVPEGLLRQMGAYAAALAQIYPHHRIETAILWTRAAQLMPIPAALATAALERACPA
ncbi:MAG: double-strand break repair helicase AddA [Rhodobacteraceae bacterium]|nr:double-strand break repair helicase AddA [Paracoccaceae bacterium]